jgi:hypothetical protein
VSFVHGSELLVAPALPAVFMFKTFVLYEAVDTAVSYSVEDSYEGR